LLDALCSGIGDVRLASAVTSAGETASGVGPTPEAGSTERRLSPETVFVTFAEAAPQGLFNALR
jgi:hypothetical protein